jgi:hypothetical protein
MQPVVMQSIPGYHTCCHACLSSSQAVTSFVDAIHNHHMVDIARRVIDKHFELWFIELPVIP